MLQSVYLDVLFGCLERRPVAALQPSSSSVIVEALVRPRDDLGGGGRLEDHSRVHGLGGVLRFDDAVIGVVGHEAEGILAHGRRGRFLLNFGGGK